ncbi:MAG: hypothetical protein AAFO96_25795, partial [Bacteroidota bacterium]
MNQDDKGGFKAISKLRANFPHVKFIVITKNGTAGTAIDALRTDGVEEYLEKQQFQLKNLEKRLAIMAKMVPRVLLCSASDTQFFSQLLETYL